MEHFQEDSDKAINPVASSCLVDEISSVRGSIFVPNARKAQGTMLSSVCVCP